MATRSEPAGLAVPEAFQRSYENLESYPRNLLYQTTSQASLEYYASRLDRSASTLFVESDSEIHVPFREYTGEAWQRYNVLSDSALKEKLGDQSRIDVHTLARVGELATKEDPICRFIFVWAEDSVSSLRITRKMLLRILSYHQVMPSYLDFISVFGLQIEQRDLQFSGFRSQVTIRDREQPLEIQSLRRSGRLYQLFYNLKAVSSTTAETYPWSVRQAAIHHQFDIDQGTALWIITEGGRDLKASIQKLTGSKGRPVDQNFTKPVDCFRSSLAVHLLLCQWSTEQWRWYIQWLESEMVEKTRLVVHGVHRRGDSGYIFGAEDLQRVQQLEDKTNEALMILEANTSVLCSLKGFYQTLGTNLDFSLRNSCQDEILAFAGQVDDMIYDSRMQISRAKVLLKITTDRKSLIYQHLQTQATEKMETITKNMMKEAISMRIMTVVTLIYLPVTFVSKTFFSTDFVQFAKGNTGSLDLRPALTRWIEVTLPLVAVTLGSGFFVFKLAGNQRTRPKLPDSSLMVDHELQVFV